MLVEIIVQGILSMGIVHDFFHYFIWLMCFSLHNFQVLSGIQHIGSNMWWDIDGEMATEDPLSL